MLFTQRGDPGALDERLECHLFCAAARRQGCRGLFRKLPGGTAQLQSCRDHGPSPGRLVSALQVARLRA